MTVSVKSTEQVTNADGRKLLISKIPDKYKTDPYYLANVAVVAMIAYFCAGLFGNKISPTIPDQR